MVSLLQKCNGMEFITLKCIEHVSRVCVGKREAATQEQTPFLCGSSRINMPGIQDVLQLSCYEDSVRTIVADTKTWEPLIISV